MTESAATKDSVVRSQRTLRVLLFSHSSRLGGSEQLLVQLVRGLVADENVACTVVLPAEGPLLELLRAAGADVWIWSTHSWWWCAPQRREPDTVRRELASGTCAVLTNLPAAIRLDPDVVFSITTVIPWGGLTASLLGKPHVWYVTDFGRACSNPLEYFYPFEDVRLGIKDGADRVLVVSKAVRERLFADAGEPPQVIYPHLEMPPTGTIAPEQRQSGSVRLGVFGNLRPSKGQWDAVSALAKLLRRGLNVELLLVGPAGPEADLLEKHAHSLGVVDRIHIVGFVPDQHTWMNSCDIILVPSHEETFSLVCLEALMHGKPLVATRVGGIEEFIHDRENGLTVAARDPDALAEAVETLIHQPALALELVEKGRRGAYHRFTAERFTGEVRLSLEEVVNRGRHCEMPPVLLAPLAALATEYQDIEAEVSRLRAAEESRLRAAEESRLDETETPGRRHRAMTWVQRLKRVFKLDIET